VHDVRVLYTVNTNMPKLCENQIKKSYVENNDIILYICTTLSNGIARQKYKDV